MTLMQGVMRRVGLITVAAVIAAGVTGCPPEEQVVIVDEPEEVYLPPEDAEEVLTEAEIAEADGEIATATAATFEELVLDAEVPVLVDFYADWCPPCRTLQPTLEEIAADYAGRARVVKVDVDADPDLAEQYEVSGIPALFVIKDGEVVDQTVGAQPKPTLESMLDEHLD